MILLLLRQELWEVLKATFRRELGPSVIFTLAAHFLLFGVSILGETCSLSHVSAGGDAAFFNIRFQACSFVTSRVSLPVSRNSTCGLEAQGLRKRERFGHRHRASTPHRPVG